MDKPSLSDAFTVEDIRKLRDYNSARHINMTTEEIQREQKSSIDKFNKYLGEMKEQKVLATK